MADNRKLWQHWPAMTLGVLVAAFFGTALVVFQVDENELAVVMRFDKPRAEAVNGAEAIKVYPPGLHVKWPYPVETVWKHDGRIQSYELTRGQVEQIPTADEYQIIVTTYVLWRVGDPAVFLKAVKDTASAEQKLDDIVRSARLNVLGRHNLTELVNVDPAKVKLPEIEKEILTAVQGQAREKYGIEVVFTGFKQIGVPEDVTGKIFARMQAERERKSKAYRDEGRLAARQIEERAKLTASELLTTAESEAKGIRGEGDRAAAEYYAVFGQAPELAAFLRKLESLRSMVTEKTTLVLDTRTAPFDLLQPGATELQPAAGPARPPPAAVPEKK